MFDLTAVSTESSFDPIPQGVYPAYVEGAEWKVSKNSGSEYLNIKFNVFGEKYANRKVFNIYNLFHAKDQVRNIAMSDIKRLLLASGFDNDLNFDSKEALVEKLLQCRCELKVAIKSDDFGEKNVIKGYDTLSGGTDSTPADCPF